MGDVVAFRTAERRAEERRLADVARQLIDELGEEAGHQVGMFARSDSFDPAARTRLLAIVKEIERQQGFGWFFVEELERSAAT